MLPLVDVPVARFRAKPKDAETQADRVARAAQARRGVRAKSVDRGHEVGYTENPASGQVHVVGSMVAQLSQAGTLEGGIDAANVRYRKIAGRGRRNLLFVVDTSGSMLSSDRLAMVKGCVMSLLEDAYRTRTRVAIVGYGGARARLVLPFTSSPELAARRIEGMKGGGSTPLVDAVGIAAKLLDAAGDEPVGVVLLSDGRYNRNPGVPAERLLREFGVYCAKRGTKILLVDSGSGNRTARKRAAQLARLLHASYRSLPDMRAEDLAEAAVEV